MLLRRAQGAAGFRFKRTHAEKICLNERRRGDAATGVKAAFVR